MLINEILTERVYHINRDVDRIYNRYFKELVDQIRTNRWNKQVPATETVSSAELTNRDAVRAHALNPITIVLHDHRYGNQYIPQQQQVHLNLNEAAMQLVAAAGSVPAAITQLPPAQAQMFKSEFTEEKVKGSIDHELTHWIDDTMNNRHILNRLTVAAALPEPHRTKHMRQQRADVALTNYEMNAQIAAIKQLKRKYRRVWDTISFEEMVTLSAALLTVSKKILQNGTETDRQHWKKSIMRRMARENLLGAGMKFS